MQVRGRKKLYGFSLGLILLTSFGFSGIALKSSAPVMIESSMDIFFYNWKKPQIELTSLSRETEEAVIVPVWAVADEEYRRSMSLFRGDWKYEVFTTVEAADDAFYREFGINFVVMRIGEWSSDDDENRGWELLKKAQAETGWNEDKKAAHVLIVFTGQDIGEHAGFAEHYSGNTEADAVLVSHQFDFGQKYKDWHVLQMELSHLYGASDHANSSDPSYDKFCIMSYKWMYYVDSWAEECSAKIRENKHRLGIVGGKRGGT